MDTRIEASDSRLKITINNKRPVGLTDLTMSLLNLAAHYRQFIEHEVHSPSEDAGDLIVKEVRTGSIVIELINKALPLAPLLWQGGSLYQWAVTISSILDYLMGKSNEAPRSLEKKELEQIRSMLDPVAKDPGSSMMFETNDNSSMKINVYINSDQANQVQGAIEEKISALKQSDENIHTKQVLTWHQAKLNSGSDTGDKALIESIKAGPVKVIFDDQGQKQQMLRGDDRFQKQWHQLAYVVDVEVQTIGGAPKVYKIVGYHPQYTFDPSE